MAPAALRKRLLDDLGYLQPDDDVAWRMVREWAVEGRRTFDSLPQPVWEAAEAVGGSWAIRTGVETTIHAQYREAYKKARARSDRETMERTHDPLLEVGHGRDDRRSLNPGDVVR